MTLPYGRKLPYPFSYVKALVQETGAFAVGDTSQQQEANFYVICMTQEQQLRFTSALQAGYDLIYPDTWQSDLDVWLQAREFPNSIPPNCTIEFDMTLSGRLGVIFAWPDDTAPAGAIPCLGQTICGNDYPDFFAQDGISEWPGYSEFGIPPCESFGSYTLPDLTNRMIVGSGDEYGISTSGGAGEVSLTVPQLPPHSHSAKVSGSGGTGSFAFLNNLTAGTFGAEQPGFIQNTGSGNAHENMPPYGAWLWCMWVEPETIFEFGDPVSNIYATDCVIYQNKNGSISEVLNVLDCVGEGTGGELVPGGDETLDASPLSLDCAYGGAVQMMDYVLDNLVGIMEKVQAGGDFLQDIFAIQPGGTVSLARKLFAAINEVVIPTVISELNNPDYREDRYCDLFCYATQNFQNPLAPTSFEMSGFIATYNIIGNIKLFINYMMAFMGAGLLAKRYNFGTDECDNDWLLCDCVTEIELGVSSDGTPDNGVVVNGAEYIVSWSGVVDLNTSVDRLFDGVYVELGGDGNWFLHPTNKLQYSFDGSVWFNVPEPEKSFQGYNFKVNAVSSIIYMRVFDSSYIDNSGSFTIYVVPTI